MRRLAGDDREAGHAEAQRVARNALGSVVADLDRDRTCWCGSASIHSMATEPDPEPTSHSNSPRRGDECGQRHRADLALGDLPVVLEPFVGQPGRARQNAGVVLSDDLKRDRVQSGDVVERKVLRLRRPNPLA